MADALTESAEPTLRLIVGLGNPGEAYRQTRHNVGFWVLEELARRWRLAAPRLECQALTALGPQALLVRPQTFMNRSGLALRCLLETRALATADVLVVYDEVSLPLGKLRLRARGGPGGHRGMESILENLRTEDVARLRCGIAPAEGTPTGDQLVDFVLAPFLAEERSAVAAMVEKAADACELWLSVPEAEAMNRING